VQLGKHSIVKELVLPTAWMKRYRSTRSSPQPGNSTSMPPDNRKHQTRAGFRISIRFMMPIKGDADRSADVGQAVGRLAGPCTSGQLHRAVHPVKRAGQSAGIAATIQDPSVERRIVRHEEIGGFHQRNRPGPHLFERGLIPQKTPRQAVILREQDTAPRGADECAEAVLQPTVSHQDQPHGASRITAVAAWLMA
jgi:hypothetical protein